jgi:single-strand DNA-binding protein
MEHLNKVELVGTVGMVSRSETGEGRGASFSLVTNYLSRTASGQAVIETTWHRVVCYEGKNVCPVSKIERGVNLHVIGRIRNRRYTTESGEERTTSEILASKVEVVEEGT